MKVYQHESTDKLLLCIKGKKNVIGMSTLHSSIAADDKENKRLETTSFYNETKCGDDIVDQTAWKYSMKAGCRR